MEDDEFEAAGDAEENRMSMLMLLVVLPSEGLGEVW